MASRQAWSLGPLLWWDGNKQTSVQSFSCCYFSSAVEARATHCFIRKRREKKITQSFICFKQPASRACLSDPCRTGETIQENWIQHYQLGTKACSQPLLSVSLSSSPSNSILKMQTTVKLLARLAVMLFCIHLLSKSCFFSVSNTNLGTKDSFKSWVLNRRKHSMATWFSLIYSRRTGHFLGVKAFITQQSLWHPTTTSEPLAKNHHLASR